MGSATKGGQDADVIVIGGGAMGSAAAWQLAERGVDVLLLERFEPGHTQGASHGASRIFRVSYPDPLHIGLAREAQQLWRELEQASGVPLLTVTGGVDHGTADELDVLHDGLTAAGVESHWLGATEAADRWPGLRFDGRALYHPGSGRLHADHAVSALQSVARGRGTVALHRTRVTRVEVLPDDTVAVSTEQDFQPLRARRVVVAAGAWTDQILAGLLPLPRLRVTQEQPAHFTPLGTDENDWPSFTHRRAGAATVYGMGTPGEGVKVGLHGVGPRIDPEHRDFRPRAEQSADLHEYVRTWLPGVDASSAVPVTCTYTSTADEVFVLDRRGPIVVAAGFSGHGFKFVPAIGRILADLVEGAPPVPEFALDRPRRVAQPAV
ncbi:FAD-dependent oxidoreductase [Kineosporia sp. J2-2]|uniref:FAD-dependent oxidoreductase n=1 Tax=Kineosporia corallincola TaxID=2835133 RepID=A0ABS5TF52_9ACTN|nr:FAD-dependent oxidoreductase [Kineosporia corallincola]MBT0769713.1 FAD-dependent oxidoreductase [Kineosporia corallincola]